MCVVLVAQCHTDVSMQSFAAMKLIKSRTAHTLMISIWMDLWFWL